MYSGKGLILVDKKIFEMLKKLVKLIDEKKGIKTKVFDLGDLSIITDYFVITEGDNPKQVKAIVENILERFPKTPQSYEGLDRKHWVVLDFGDFMVHVFQSESRVFYDLESLWGENEVDLDERIEFISEKSRQ